MSKPRRKGAPPRPGVSSPPALERRPPAGAAWAAAALAALVLLTYLPALWAGFVWDDDVNVTHNQALGSLDGLRRIWFEPGATVQYYPLTFTTHWLEVQILGLAPLPFHLANVLLHALNAILVWRLLLLLEVPAAWFAAALFALHPVHVESVAWITERKNVLSTAFALGAAIVFLRGALADRPRRGWYAISLLLFVAALLSKTVTSVLPAALLVVVWWKHGRLRGRDAYLLAPYFALGLAAAMLTSSIERIQVGAHGADWSRPWLERLLIAGGALWFYAGKLAWPHPVMFNYPTWTVDPGTVGPYLVLFAALALPIVLFVSRGRVGSGPLVAALCFGGALLPVLGVFDFYAMRYAYAADHFAYLPSIAFVALAAAGAAALARFAGETSKPAFAAAGGVVLLVLGALTQAQSLSYRDEETLWRDTLRANPSSWMAHNNLGSLLSRRGKLDEAIPHWREALRLDPNRSEIHQNLGGAAKAQGRLDESVAHYRRALELEPDSAEIRMNLGVVLTAQGRLDEAVEQYRESLRLASANATAHNDLGVALAALGRVDEAIAAYRAALALDPAFARAHNNLGLALAGTGHLEEALAHDAEAVRLAPDMPEAHNNYAIALEKAGRADDALLQYREVVRLAPSIPEARYNLAAALAKRGETKEAVAQYHEALRLRPQFPQAEAALARLLGE